MRLLSALANPRWSMYWFAGAIVLLYAAVPSLIGLLFEREPAFFQLSGLAICAVAGIVIGFSIPLLDGRFRDGAKLISLSARWFHIAVWGSFALFVLITIVTADSIPALTALRGATEAELSEARGAFFKVRSGWQVALGYIGAIYAGVLLPYSMSLMFLAKKPIAFLSSAAFLLYSVLSLQKAMFVQVLAPLLTLVAQGRLWRAWAIIPLLFVGAVVLAGNTILSRGSETAADAVLSERLSNLDELEKLKIIEDIKEQASLPFYLRDGYFTADYIPQSTLDQITWRSLAVPVFTASDGIKVFKEKFDNRPFLGATSSLLAAILHIPRVNYDAEIFEYQWGKSDIGRANAVYFIEGYVNFGILGVIFFSIFVGQALRWFWKSKDQAFSAMWPLFCWNIFSAGLMGTLLSNGYILLFIGVFLVQIDTSDKNRIIG